ncbi:MAG: hypothetical protein JO340_16185 [Acidobacteriaceae bacterium]|nr:hypothetical protein [Acidobacteriaceae bacterium]
MRTKESEIESQSAHLNALFRERRRLTEAMGDADSDVGRQQEVINGLASRLTDAASDGIEKEIATERQKLKRLVEIQTQARLALRSFEERNPSEAELKQREQDLQRERLEIEQRQAVAAARAKLAALVNLLLQAETACEELQSDYRAALQRWPSNNGPLGVVRAGGIPGFLVDLPALSESGGAMFGALEKIGRWNIELLPADHRARIYVEKALQKKAEDAAFQRSLPTVPGNNHFR